MCLVDFAAAVLRVFDNVCVACVGRFWKKVFVKLTETSGLQLFNTKEDKDPFQELPLQACYSVSDIGQCPHSLNHSYFRSLKYSLTC